MVRGFLGSLRQAGGLRPTKRHKGRRLRARVGWVAMRDWVSGSSSNVLSWKWATATPELGNRCSNQAKLVGG